ncbi:MAG: CHASE3 domain-containing protein [Pseudonocardiaceae bacterium]
MADPTSRGHWSLRRWLRLVGAICLSAAIVAIASGALALAHLSAARTVLVDHLDPAFLSAQALSAALVNQETGVRGFAATGDRAFLAPYQEGRQQEDAALTTLRRLGAAEPPRTDLARTRHHVRIDLLLHATRRYRPHRGRRRHDRPSNHRPRDGSARR